jgi:hypothetical protein
MTLREFLTAWFTDAATRHPLILHTTVKPRFFELEFDLILQNGVKAAMTGWTVILEDYTTGLRDNDADYISKVPKLAFWVIKHVPHGKKADLQDAYEDAEGIAQDIIAKLYQDSLDGICDADVPAAITIVPRSVDLNSVSFQPLGPELDNAYGTRCTVNIRMDKEVNLSRTRVAWVALP